MRLAFARAALRRPSLRRAGLLAAAALAAALPAAASRADAPSAADWRLHLTEDLLPFWSTPEARGVDGLFPSERCNDGGFSSAGDICPESPFTTETSWTSYVVAQSRQVFGYGVAFHMTGDSQWLDLAKAGTETLFSAFKDDGSALFNRIVTNAGVVAGAPSGQIAQTQAYGLLGPTFLYYLTGDAALLAEIEETDAAFEAAYGLGGGAYRRVQSDAAAGDRLATHLDVLNTYLHLLADVGPAADRAEYLARAHAIATHVRDAYWQEDQGLFAVSAADPTAEGDFGHSAKTMWFTLQIAAQAGDAELLDWALARTEGLLSQAFRADTGSWATLFRDGAITDGAATYWIAAELGQLAASLSIDDPAQMARLEATQAWWLANMVDPDFGGTWVSVDPDTGEASAARKAQEWKSAFHSFEHALVAYLSAAAREGEDAVLWFARDSWEDPLDFSAAYVFEGEEIAVRETDLGGLTAQEVRYGGLSFAALAQTPVPLPAGAALLPLGLLAIGAARGRARGRAEG